MRRPLWIVYAFVIGLALHNLVMAELWKVGVRGGLLELISAWKEALLALGLVLVLLGRRSLRFRPILVDWLALAYGTIVVVYGLIPQHWLGGSATHHGVLLAEREDLLPVGCYAFGRGLVLGSRELRGIQAAILATAAAVAAFGILDIYLVPLSWWRTSSGAVGWFSHQLGFHYGPGLSGLPQNFVYNTGGGHFYRRLVSSFLSPLASADLLVVALLVAAVWRFGAAAPLRLWAPLTALLGAALLLTHSRSAYIALALGLLVAGSVRPAWRLRLAVGCVSVVVVGFAFLEIYSQLAPRAALTASELRWQAENAHTPGAVAAQSGLGDSSTHEHLQNLRAGIDEVLHHPQGYGPGNAGSSAARTGVAPLAGESTYTEVGVDAGLAGALAFIVWSLVLWLSVLRANAWIGASLAAALALAVQTDVLGVPWLVYVVWTLAGSCLAVKSASAAQPQPGASPAAAAARPLGRRPEIRRV